MAVTKDNANPKPAAADLNDAEGVTTRDDATDMGVPMLPGDVETEPVGPEDALGVGPKRGDYSDRIGPSNYHPHEAVRSEGKTVVEAQRPRVEDRGDEKGVKGGTSAA